jgi:RNA polymerase sigma-70 factor (ECF subfamily)
MSDLEVVERIKQGEAALFEVLMRRYNARIYRVVRSILGREADVEDVMQQAYLNAFLHLDQFAGQAQFSTWFTRIAVHEALRRARKADRMPHVDELPDREPAVERLTDDREPSPEHRAYGREMAVLLEQAVDALPDGFRSVFVLREVEGLTTRETAECLDVNEDTVKTRLHRAKAQLRRDLAARIGDHASSAYVFHAPRCDRVVAAVLAQLTPRTS